MKFMHISKNWKNNMKAMERKEKNDELKVFGLQIFTCSQKKICSELVKIVKDYRWKILYEPTISWS